MAAGRALIVAVTLALIPHHVAEMISSTPVRTATVALQMFHVALGMYAFLIPVMAIMKAGPIAATGSASRHWANLAVIV